jgi:hypothetical protein
MAPWLRRLLSLLLLVLVATSSLLNLLQDGAAFRSGDLNAPFVLVEQAEECEAEEFDDLGLLPESGPNRLVFDVVYTAHIAEELETDRVRHLRSHFLRGPPSA